MSDSEHAEQTVGLHVATLDLAKVLAWKGPCAPGQVGIMFSVMTPEERERKDYTGAICRVHGLDRTRILEMRLTFG